jgi:hypothetical protein
MQKKRFHKAGAVQTAVIISPLGKWERLVVTFP